MLEAALSTILEQAISKELRTQLMYVPISERNAHQGYHDFGRLLQNLENNRRSYGAALVPSYAHALARTKETQDLAQSIQSPNRQPPSCQMPIDDPMDLSSSCRQNRKEQGLCFRYGSAKHLVANCPQPDNRIVQTRPMIRNGTPESSRRSSLERRRSSERRRSPGRRQTHSRRYSESENGTSLD